MQRNPKYAVLKWEDWERVRENAEEVSTAAPGIAAASLDALLLADAEVIRGQDITAAPVFHAYAAIILSYRDLVSTEREPRVLDHLTDIADHFHEAAIHSERRVDRRLPT